MSDYKPCKVKCFRQLISTKQTQKITCAKLLIARGGVVLGEY